MLTVVCNEEEFDATFVQRFKDHLNADVFLGFPPRTVKCQDITSTRQYHADYGYYWEVTYEFEVREKITADDGTVIVAGWDEEVLNCGLRELDLDGNPRAICIKGAPVTSPVLLTLQGRHVGSSTEPHYLTFKMYLDADFDKLAKIPKDLLEVASELGRGGS